MRRINLFYSFFMLLPGIALAQASHEVISSGGGTAQGQTIVLDWTLGEPMVETAIYKDRMITQGFHQPVIQIYDIGQNAQIATRTLGSQEFMLSPNPAKSVLTLDIDPPLKHDIDLVITNAEGSVVQSQKIPTGTERSRLDISGIPPGLFILSLYDTEHALVKSFMISKIQ